MARSNIVTHLVVEYNQSDEEVTVYHFNGNSTRPRSPKERHKVEISVLAAAIEDYWDFVDRSIRDNVFKDGESEKANRFLGDLEARGQEIADLVFPRHIQEDIWKAADVTDILLLSTNLEDIPWEALYCANAGDNSGFISRNCVLQRQIESGNIETRIERTDRDGVLLCIDPELIEEEDRRGQIQITNELSNLKAKLYRTSSSRDLAKRTKNASVVHWLCEHVSDAGLRLGKGAYYSMRDADTHKFPSNSVLFMLSCASGRLAKNAGAFSARVSAASGCTVVAPSSIVAVGEAVQFIKDIQEILDEHPGAKLSEIWSLLKAPYAGREGDDDEFTWRDCYLLWFGIYGDCEAVLN